MARLLVAYGTGEGQTAHVANALADRLRLRGDSAYVADLEHERPNLDEFDGALIGGSVHAARFQAEVREYVMQNVDRLNAMPSWFFGVSLSEAGRNAPVDPANASKQISSFLAATNWTPRGELSVAGALKYREYNAVKRLLLKHIARKAGEDTDTSRDWEYTNWAAVDQFADRVGATLQDSKAVELSTR